MKPRPPSSAAAAPDKQRRKRSNPSPAATVADGTTDSSPTDDEFRIAAAAVGGTLTPKALPGSNMAILLQNCDLPPPQKLFGPDDLVTGLARAGKPNFSSSPIKPRPCLGSDDHHDVSRMIRDAAGDDKATHKDNHPWMEGHQDPILPGDKNTGGLLKAMRLSQTRAREAEAKASQLGKTTEKMALLLLDESMRLHAYRQWVMLLQAEIAILEKRRSARGVADHPHAAAADVDDGSDAVEGSGDDCRAAASDGGSISSRVGPCTGNSCGSSTRATWVAWAVVLAVAGVGLAVGCKYLF